MDSDGLGWTLLNSVKTQLDSDEHGWTPLDLDGLSWTLLDSYGLEWNHSFHHF